jgi:hypothetical protein
MEDTLTERALDRPIILTGGELHTLAHRAWKAIAAANDPPLTFQRGGALVYIGKDGNDRAVLRQHDKDSLSELMSATARWRRLDKDDEPTIITQPPERVARVILSWSSERYVGAPEIKQVAHAPFFAAPKGTTVWEQDEFGNPDHEVQLITEPGFHTDLGVYYDPDPALRDLPPVTGRDEDLPEAVEIINTMLADFPFAGRASTAHAISLLLLPFVRELIDGDTPMYLITAPTAGTGKGLLTDVLLSPATGRIPRAVAAEDEAEWRKRITAKLLDAPPVILIDNVPEGVGLKSTSVAAVLTAGGWWEDRQLGKTRTLTLPVRNVWVATGNNVQVSDENARRIARIHLDHGVEDPAAMHHFKIPNLAAWSQTHRADIVWAALTIIQNWLLGHTVEGDHYRPWVLQGSRMKQSFLEWSRVLGGILRHIKVEGFGEQEDLVERPDQDELAVFFNAWAREVPEPVTAKALAVKCYAFASELNDALPAELTALPMEQLKAKMAYWLRSRKDKVAGGFRLVKVPVHGAADRWRLVAIETSTT